MLERMNIAIQQAEQALLSLQTVMAITTPTEIERDAAIQRFEFTFEAIWKTSRIYLRELEGIDSGSPKGVIRACRETGILSAEDTILALEMVNDRNLTSHTYDRDLALEIYERLAGHTMLMAKWLEKIRSAIKEIS